MPKKNAMDKPENSGEIFYIDANRIPRDAELHDAILDNPEADNFTARMSCAAMIVRGVEPSLAQILDGVVKLAAPRECITKSV
jgi:hypothetical protein